MKTILISIALTSMLGASSSKREYVAQVNFGDKFYTLDKNIIEKEIKEEMNKTNTNFAEKEYVKHTHGKLGNSYSVKAKLYKCER